MQEPQRGRGLIPGQKIPGRKGMAAHSVFCLNPWTENSAGLQIVKHNQSDLAWMHVQSKAGITEDSDVLP